MKPVRSMCYFHVLHSIEKFLKVLPKETREHIKTDIQFLQLSDSEETFLEGVDLFLNKWRGRGKSDVRITTFIDYFQGQWVLKNAAWYEGAAPGTPGTNNGLESTNAVIKRSHTFREGLPVSQFLETVRRILRSWSECRNDASVNCKHFASTPTVSLKQWTAA